MHQFRQYNAVTGKEELSPKMATLAAITETEGLVMVEGSDETIDSDLLDENGFTREDLKPPG